MAVALRLALWNANGVSSHRLELQTFLDMHEIDIALISETNFTSRTVFRLPRYTVFHSIHHDDTAHGGAAVIIRNSVRHHEHLRLQTPELQAIAFHLEALPWPLTVSAVNCPPCHATSSAIYSDFFRSLGPRFLDGGDRNAKLTTWGGRRITPKGRTFLSAIRGCHGTYFSLGEPTYWPTDHQRLPDLLDFFVPWGIAASYIRVEPVFELSSDHSPILATVGAHILSRVVTPTLTTNHTDWDAFRAYTTTHIDLHLLIKQRSELNDATHHFTTFVQDAAWHSSPPPRKPLAPVHATTLHTRNFVTDKRRARSRWQRSRNQGDRDIYNRLKRNLQAALRDARNATFTIYITSPSPDDTSLWKATKVSNDSRSPYTRSGHRMVAGLSETSRRLRPLGNIFAKCSRRSRLFILTTSWSPIP